MSSESRRALPLGRLRIPAPSKKVTAWATILGVAVSVIALAPIFDATESDLEAVKISTEGTQLVPVVNEGRDRNPPSSQPAARLDLRLRNKGDVAAAITDVGIKVNGALKFDLCFGAGPFESPSALYDLTIPASAKVGDALSTSAAQSIAAGSTDRFLLSLGTRADLGVIYDLEVFVKEGDNTTNLGSVIVLLPPSARNAYRVLAWSGGYNPRMFDRDCAATFGRKLSEMVESDGVIASGVEQLLSDAKVASQEGLEALPPISE